MKRTESWSPLVVLLASVVSVVAGGMSARADDRSVNRTKDGVGIQGYDPVSYADGKPTRGTQDIEFTFEGTRYRFQTVANRERFAMDPQRYLPQYGGFCAYAVSRGYTASIDPLAWRSVDGKLYLNYSKRVQRLWEEDIPGNIAKGDANWPGIAAKR